MDEPLVTVPPEPGRLRRRDDRDALDEALDEVLGPPPEGGAGLTDLLLVVAGAGLVVAVLLGAAAPALAVLGAGLLLLGLALPARALMRRPHRAVLAVADPHVDRLARAHDRVVDLVGPPSSDLAGELLGTAHLAVLEVASLLQGRRTSGPAEREYCDVRTAALEQLAATLVRRPVAEDAQRRELVAGARRDLEQHTGQGAAARLDTLRRALDGPA